jgi:hypothetical protein
MRAVIDTGVLVSAAIKMQSAPSLAGQSGEGRKQFFFEKKNQKTFVSGTSDRGICTRSAARPKD